MPIIDLPRLRLDAPVDTPKGFAVTPGAADMDPETPTDWYAASQAAMKAVGSTSPIGLGATLPGMAASPLTQAAFRQGNTFGSLLSETARADRDAPTRKQEGFHPWEKIKGTNLEEHWESFVDIHNDEAFEARKTKILAEIADRKVVNDAPWYQSVPAQMAAGVLDWPSLLPGGTFVRGAKGGFSVAKSVLSVGAAAGVATGVQEGVLQASQETRPWEESAVNIGASVFLGGLLGGAGARLLSNAEWRGAVRALERELETGAASLERGLLAESGAPASVGAAAHVPTELGANTIDGRAAGAVAAATERLNPGLRIIQSPSAAVRDIGVHLFENVLYLKKNSAGVASEPAVETLMKEWNGGLAAAVRATRDTFLEYRKAGGTLKRAEFQDEVGRAMRREDKHADPHIAKVAQQWRNAVIEPLKEEGIAVGLLPKDVTVETAPSYFSRMWNRTRLNAEEGRFKEIVTGYYRGAIAQEYETSRALTAKRFGRIDQEIEDLKLSGPDRATLLETLSGDLTRLRAGNAPFEDLNRSVGEFHSQAAKARAEGKPDTASQMLARAKELAEKGGDAYADYVSARNMLAQRVRRIRNNVAGREDQTEAIRQRIADAEVANLDRLRRLHKSLTTLDGQTGAAAPELLEAELSRLRTEFSQVLERSAKAQDRLAKATEKQNAAAPDGAAPPAAKADHTAFDAAEMKRIEEMAELSERISDLEKVDPEEALRLLRETVEARLEQTAGLIEREGMRIASRLRMIEKADPKLIEGRVERLARAKAEAERRFFDRWETRNLGQGVDPASNVRPDFTDAAREIANHTFDSLTGRAGDSIRPEFVTVGTRGPMKERTFNIPDHLIEDFLEHDVEVVGRRYTRIMGADVELARKFGSPDMKEQLQSVRSDYERLRQGVTNEKELKRLGERETADLRDLEALRDLLRGSTYFNHPIEQNYSRATRVFNHFNYLRSMGEVALASLTETVRPAMVHGLMPYLGTVANLATNLKGIKMSVAEAKLAGNVSERILGTRLATLSEIVDPYASRGPVEAFMENMTNFASKWNGIRMLTDMQKSISAVMTQDRLLAGATNFAKAKPSERRYLAYLGLDQSMAERIAAQFSAHGQTVDGVRVAGTESWTDDIARRTYRAAINKDIDSIITTKGVADVPLFANTPTGRAVLQFKSFFLASHQRVLLRGLQEDQTRFVGGMLAMTGIGMLTTYLKAFSGNREAKLADFAENPGWWVAEGLDKSGIFSVPMELGNVFEKASGFHPIKSPIKAFDQGNRLGQRYQNRNEIGALLGPTVGLGQDVLTTAGVPKKLIEDGKPTTAQKNAMERLMPFNSYAGIRQMLRYVVNTPD